MQKFGLLMAATVLTCAAIAAEAKPAKTAKSKPAAKKPAPAAKTSDVAEVYLLAGQSNMQGIGFVKDLPAELRKAIPNVKIIFAGKAFEPMVVGKTRTSNRAGEMGPEVGLAWALSKAKPGKTIYIIKYAASGKPLHCGWANQKWVGPKPGPKRVNFYPGLRDGDPNVGGCYRTMMRRFRAGLALLDKQKIAYRVAGIAWMQGEQDSKHVISAQEYPASLKFFKQRVEQDVKAPASLPLVFGQVLPHAPAMARFVARETIRKRMAQADCDSGHADAIPLTKMISTDKMPLRKDGVHYDAKGQLMLGTAFAKALIKLQFAPVKQTKKPAPKQSCCPAPTSKQ